MGRCFLLLVRTDGQTDRQTDVSHGHILDVCTCIDTYTHTHTYIYIYILYIYIYIYMCFCVDTD